MINPRLAKEFLTHHRLAVVGASADPKKFGTAIYRELKGRNYDVVAINPNAETVDGDPCYPDFHSLPEKVEGAILVIPGDKSAEVVRQCVAAGIPRVWLFKGIGGQGAVSDEAVELCSKHGVELIAGACPFMFLEPTGWFHRAHRVVRQMKGDVREATAAARV